MRSVQAAPHTPAGNGARAVGRAATILGGGPAGLAAGYALSAAGWSVQVFEQDPVAYGALVGMWTKDFRDMRRQFIAPRIANYRGNVRTPCGIMSANNAAPVASEFVRSAIALLPAAKRSPIMPDPTIAIKSITVPTASATTRLFKEAR